MRNFHLPLPEEVYMDLKTQAEQMKRPATSVAREAIEAWLRHCRKVARHQAISEFAKEFAGSEYDLDSQLEAAGVDHLTSADRDSA
jgi:hypothetical protein